MPIDKVTWLGMTWGVEVVNFQVSLGILARPRRMGLWNLNTMRFGGDWTLSIISWEYDWMPRAGRSNQWKSIEQLFPREIWPVFPCEIETPNSKFHKIIWSPKYSQQKQLPFALKGDLFEPTPKCCRGAFAVEFQWTFTINYIVGGVHRRKFQGVPYNLDVQSKT